MTAARLRSRHDDEVLLYLSIHERSFHSYLYNESVTYRTINSIASVPPVGTYSFSQYKP